MTAREMKKIGRYVPHRCECGGVLDYDYDFGRIFVVCKKCSPVVVLRPSRKGVRLGWIK